MMETVKNLLLVTLPTLLILFLLVEGYFRIQKEHLGLYELTGREETTNPMENWAKTDAFSAYSAKPDTSIKGKTVNSHGFISTPPIKVDKPTGTKRVVFLGGSSTAGMGKNLKDEETWPWKVMERLRKKTDMNLEFINAALGGYTTYESYGRLWSRIRFFDPDILVVYHGWNEMYYFNEKTQKNPAGWRKDFRVDKKVKTRIFQPHWVDPLVSWSQFLTRIRLSLINNQNMGEVAEGGGGGSLKADFNKKGLDIFSGNLTLIKGFSQAENCSLFVCKQATLITEKTSEKDRKRCNYRNHGFDHKAHVAAFDSIYNRIDNIFPPRSMIDLTNLSGRSELFHDHVHPTTKGTTKIARVVADSLLNNYFYTN